MPGRIFRSSAADRPTMAMFWICSPRDRGALLARRHRRELSDRGDSDLLGESRDAQLDRREVALLAESQDHALGVDRLEPGELHLHREGAGRHGREDEVARFVGDGGPLVAGEIVEERDGRARQHRVARIDDRAAERTRQRLRARRQKSGEHERCDSHCAKQYLDRVHEHLPDIPNPPGLPGQAVHSNFQLCESNRRVRQRIARLGRRRARRRWSDRPFPLRNGLV